MDKKAFWLGAATGVILVIATGFYIKDLIFNQPQLDLAKIEVTELDGTTTSLTKYKGKPTVINCWATWCAPCIKEFPYFKEVMAEYQDRVNFVMVSDDTASKVNAFEAKRDFDFNYLISPKKLGEYGVIARPTTYFYDAEGNLIKQHTSELSPEMLRAFIEAIL